MQDWPSGTTELEIGRVYFAWTQADHVHICTESGAYVTVRGVQYHVGLHLFLRDGKWGIRDFHDLYVSRFDSKDASQPARRTILDLLSAFWMGYASKNAQLGQVAERVHLQNEFDKLAEEIGDLNQKVKDKEAEQHKLQLALDALDG